MMRSYRGQSRARVVGSLLGLLVAVAVADAAPQPATLVSVTTYPPSGGAGGIMDRTADTSTWTFDQATGTAVQTGGTFSGRVSVGISTVFTDTMTGVTLGSGAATAASWACTEGNFGGFASAHICGNYNFGADFINDSIYTATTTGATVTLQGDDTASGSPRSLAIYDGMVSIDMGAGTFLLSNAVPPGGPAGAAPGGSYEFIFQVGGNAVDDGPVVVTEGVPAVIPVGANDIGFADPVTVMVTSPPTKGSIGAISPTSPAAGQNITYTANIGATGGDTFVYEMTDSTPGTPVSDLATVSLSISAAPLAVSLLRDAGRNSTGTLFFQAFKTCAPATGNGCYNPANAWNISKGVTGSDATWDWNSGTGTLTATGTFWTTSFIASNPSGQSVISDKTVNLAINTVAQTTTGGTYNCIEGSFLPTVNASGCLNTNFGTNSVDESTVLYNVGGDANCVQRTLGGDDTSIGNPRGLFTAAAAGGCDAVAGSYDLYTVVSDATATGGNLVISNGIPLGTCVTLGCPAEPASANARWLTFAPGAPGDATPSAFGFTDQTSVPVSTVRTSNTVTILGLTSAAAVTVTGGTYSIGCTATFVSSAGTVNNGDSICVRHTSAAVANTSTNTTLTIGGVSDTFTSTTAGPTVTATPSTPSPGVGSSFTVTLSGSDFVNLGGATVQLSFDASKVAYVSASLPATGPLAPGTGSFLVVNGTNPRILNILPGAPTVNGNFDAAVITFNAVAPGNSGIVFSDDGGNASGWFASTTAAFIPVIYIQASVNVVVGDTTPDPFVFTDPSDVALSTPITSAPITVAGINAPAAISVSGAASSVYSINAGPFTSTTGSVSNGDSVTVRHTSSASLSTATDTMLTIGGVSDTFTSTTVATPPPDTTPEPFSFTDQTNAPLLTTMTSNAVVITGINTPAAISVTGGTYSIGCTATFTAIAGAINNGQSVCVQHTSSAYNSVATHTVLTVGGVSDTFTSTTVAVSTIPITTAASSNGISSLYSATFDAALTPCGGGSPSYCTFFGGTPPVVRNMTTTPAPTGVAASAPAGITPTPAAGSSLNLARNPGNTTLTLTGGTIAFPNTTLTINSGGVTQMNLIGAGMVLSASPQVAALDGNGRAEFLVDLNPTTAVDFSTLNTIATGCTGPVCGLVSAGILTLDMVRYRLVIDYDPTFTAFTGEFIGQTTNNSLVYATLNTVLTTPDSFSFTDQTNAPLLTTMTSNAVAITGINTPTAISVTGGTYSIGCTATFTAIAGTINNGQSVCVQHTSSASLGTATDTMLTIGGVSDTFTSTTVAVAPSTVSTLNSSNGISSLYSATFDTALTPCGGGSPSYCAFFNGTPPVARNLTTTPAPTGMAASVPAGITPTPAAGSSLYLARNPGNTTLTLTGGTIAFPNTTLTINSGGVTQMNLIGAGMVLSASPQVAALDGNGRAEFLVDLNPATAVDFSTLNTIATGCTGPNCALVTAGILTLDMVRYRLVIDYDPTFTAFTGEFIGQTANNSLVYATLDSADYSDTTPQAFSFTDQSDVGLSTVRISNAVAITGINAPASVWAAGGEYSIDGGPFTNLIGSVTNNQQVRVRHTSAGTHSSSVDTALVIGGVTDTFTSTTLAADTTPDPFSFSDVSNVDRLTQQTSNAVTITGINKAASISVSNGWYSVACTGQWTTYASTIDNGQTVCVSHTSPSTPNTATDTVLTVGGVADTFTSTTGIWDATPNTFTFADQSGVALSAQVISNSITITAIDAYPVPISVTGGEFSIGCTGLNWTTYGPTINLGQTVCVRQTTASTTSTATNTVLTVGGVSDTFTTTTASVKDTVPNPFTIVDQSGVVMSAYIQSGPITITGFNAPTTISISGGTYPQYSRNCYQYGWTSGTEFFNVGETVCVRHQSAATPSTITNTVLTIGGVSDTFTTTTTGVVDTTPDSFSFVDQSGVAMSATIDSAPIPITGITAPAPISITGGEFSLNCYASNWQSAADTTNPGAPVCVRHVSAGTAGTATNTVLTIGGVSDTFTSTTLPITAPNAFSFTDQSDVDFSIDLISNPVTITGINFPASVSVTGGTFSIGCSGSQWDSVASISPGQTVCVRQTTASEPLTSNDTVLTIGGVSDTFTTTTRNVVDTTPNPFSFTDQAPVQPAVTVVSNAIPITGLSALTPISITGGEYSLGCTGSFWSASAVMMSPGITVCVRHQSASTPGTVTDTVLTIGDVSDTFTSITGADRQPDPFSFIDQTNVPLYSVVTSNTVTITGIEAPVPISVAGGEYSIGCTGNFTLDWGTITNGETVCVRHVNSGGTSTILNVGGVTDVFTSVTGGSIDTTPEPFNFGTVGNSNGLGAQVTSAYATISGINAPTTIAAGPGDLYSISCPSIFLANTGLVADGCSVAVSTVTPSSHTTPFSACVTIGGVTGCLSGQTLSLVQNPVDTSPSLFSFQDQLSVPLSSLRTSASVSLGGVAVAVPLSVSNGEYSLGCTGIYTASSVTTGGGLVCVRHTSASTLSTATHTTLTFGGGSDTFTSVTTAVIPASPPDDDGDGMPNSQDNCRLLANNSGAGAQCDSDGDGYGNRCDGDLNNNGFTNAFDTPLYRAQLGQPSVGPTYNQADLNCNGFVNAFDTPLYRSLLGKPPGPGAGP